MVRSLRGHFFAPGKHRLRAWTWLRASMSSQCQTILQQCSAHLQLEVVLIALKNACSGTKFVESSKSSLNYMYGAVTRKLLLRCARSHLYVHRPSHCFGCFKSHVNLSKSSHIDGTAFASYCIRSSFFMFTTIHYWSWYTDIHNIQQPKLRKEAGLGSKICTILMDTGECSLFSGSLFCSMFVPQGIYKRHPTVAWKTLEISDTSCHSCLILTESSPRIVASNLSSFAAAGGGRTLSAWNHGVVLHLSKGLPHLGTSTFRSLAKGLLERPGAAPLAALFKGPPFLQNFRSQQRIWRDHNWTSAWNTMIRSYQIVTSLPVRIDSKKCVEGWNSIPLDPGNTRTHILPMHWTQQHRHWLTYLSWAPWKNVQAHMKQPIATSERRQFASLQGIRQIYTYVYIYIYVWGSGLVKQESQEMSKHLHNMEPPSCKLVYKPHQL